MPTEGGNEENQDISSEPVLNERLTNKLGCAAYQKVLHAA
jgi:hypothetical protein